MGYGIVLDLKDPKWTCQQPCNHRDCAASRKEWTDAKCAICGEPMLAGQPFYYTNQDDKKYYKYPDQEHVHAHCIMDCYKDEK